MSRPLHIVIAGHVDHGKSTLVGRLLHDTGSLMDGREEELKEICKRRGTENLEWSFLLDSFQAERDQAVTIDTTQIHFKTALRPYVIIDAPGHREFIRNMMSGAAQADAAVLVVDATEGVREQTKRHADLLALIGIRQVAVLVNKMDAVNYSRDIFERLIMDIKAIGLSPAFIIPASARNGEMVAERGANMEWYSGETLVGALDKLALPESLVDKPLRFLVQDVYRIGGRRIIAGRVESGTLNQGDEILFSPYNQQARIETIEVWPEDSGKTQAGPGEVIGITLDERIFVERGHIGSSVDSAPMLSPVFRANIFRFTDRNIQPEDIFTARFGALEIKVTVQSVDKITESMTEMTLRARSLLPLDASGKVILHDGHDIIGAGAMNMDGYPDQRRQMKPKSENIRRADHLLDCGARAEMNGHEGGVFWFTGLSGAGKTTIAMAVEKALFDRGYRTYVLDGDNIRHGLNADLGFSPDDRAENIRRSGQVAALMADAGLIVIAAFISPYHADRERARAAAEPHFHEIYMQADLETCEARDSKGLYKKARAGKITGFTGIDSPYEVPQNPDCVIDTQNCNVGDCVREVLKFIESRVLLSRRASEKKK